MGLVSGRCCYDSVGLYFFYCNVREVGLEMVGSAQELYPIDEDVQVGSQVLPIPLGDKMGLGKQHLSTTIAGEMLRQELVK